MLCKSPGVVLGSDAETPSDTSTDFKSGASTLTIERFPMDSVRRFTLDGAVRRNPTVEHWFEAPPSDLRSLAEKWFREMYACGPDVTELLHDGHPTACVGDVAFGYVNAFAAHVNVGFFLGARLLDPSGLLQGRGRFMRHVKVHPGIRIDDSALKELIATAYRDTRGLLGSR